MLFQCHDAETALDQRYFYPVFAGYLFGNVPRKHSQWGGRVKFE